MIQFNYNITQETDALDQCNNVSNNHHDTLYGTVGTLASKPGQPGVARTPEMAKFCMFMQSDCQMFAKQTWKHYVKYSNDNQTDK